MNASLLTRPAYGPAQSHRIAVAELSRRRAELNRATTTHVLRIELYVLTRPGRDPAPHFAELDHLAALSSWEITGRHTDDSGDSDPAFRPGWARAVQACGPGRAHGIAAVSQVTISPHPDWYGRALEQLHAAGAGLYLLRPETHL
ncbi:hypothetical protein [Streptomyces yaizuensis]|uniref:Uncharacterized protein n=1 Tax=Streptomyces yaizuensis TaxID=2989713 RepID=A0ABQ5P6D0_9ACTN|nr:hypothetical protein [Streptomyces sp. YSPA8]GLF98122.1 hypothetical protein SYYSPA8_27515 [Streptomyces sp. YSPA8]